MSSPAKAGVFAIVLPRLRMYIADTICFGAVPFFFTTIDSMRVGFSSMPSVRYDHLT